MEIHRDPQARRQAVKSGTGLKRAGKLELGGDEETAKEGSSRGAGREVRSRDELGNEVQTGGQRASMKEETVYVDDVTRIRQCAEVGRRVQVTRSEGRRDRRC